MFFPILAGIVLGAASLGLLAAAVFLGAAGLIGNRSQPFLP